VTVHGSLLFVLNSGGKPNITGFELTSDGNLVAIRDAFAELQGTGPAQVSFDDRGERLVVTNRTSRQIEVFRFVDDKVERLYVAASAGVTPFGFDFAHNNVVVVSEAGGSSASSYRLTDDGLVPVSQAVGNTQRAACWLVVTNNGKLAYTANAQSSSVSSYSIAPDGSLQLLYAVAGNTPPMTNPIDLALSRNSSWLYSLATGTITTFRTSPQGTLTRVDVVTGLPATTAGLAAR
jgi:6-phosphogluconolactonase (cycloisomerase 2 family)